VSTHDIDPQKSTVASLRDLVSACWLIFLALPTLIGELGACDTAAVGGAVLEIDRLAGELGLRDRVVVIRSTVEPGTSARLQLQCKYIKVCHNPEFLTAANAIEDLRNQNRILLGGHSATTAVVRTFYQRVFPDIPVFETNSTTTELVKYMTNVYLNVKALLSNEFAQISRRLETDYEVAVRLATLDSRLGTSHWAVPGNDGKEGAGGGCFLKDHKALIALATRLGTPHFIMSGAEATNKVVRPGLEEEIKSLLCPRLRALNDKELGQSTSEPTIAAVGAEKGGD
jgi:UDPglucose 6-dehydrogenase